MAQEYLKRASRSVQHLIPIEILDDGNCLFNSIVSLIPDSNISAVELRGPSCSLHIYRNVSMINLST